MLRCEDYTLGRVCGLPAEPAAAQEMLSEKHGKLEHSLPDKNKNLCTLGSIKRR
jgi:hypothetical protein